MFWTAMSSIATIAAVVVALFIVKWQDKVRNCKRIRIEYSHLAAGSIIFDGFKDDRVIENILIKFINVGNRKVIIEGVKFEYSNGTSTAYRYLLAQSEHDMTLPCSLEIEEAKRLTIPYPDFINAIHEGFIRRPKDEIVIVATDTSGKMYRCRTGIRYEQYLKNSMTNNQ